MAQVLSFRVSATGVRDRLRAQSVFLEAANMTALSCCQGQEPLVMLFSLGNYSEILGSNPAGVESGRVAVHYREMGRLTDR